MIDAVLFIICTFQYLTRLAGKCLFRLQKLGIFDQFDPLNGLQYQPTPKGTPLRESALFEPLSVKMW